MPKHAAILLLVLSILSYSSVWAMHSHEDIVGHQQSVSHLGDSQSNESTHQLDDDHCCHASVHLLGLINTSFSTLSPVVHTAQANYHFYLFSYHNSPPQRPPLV
ncbi:MAG: hypothetical protein JKX87_05270 [Cycloclasticus sp.]|nr:hypothetical protein [Cycloclasticus sp.]